MEEALERLAACSPEIEAIGVTDYFTTRSFRRALAARQGGAGSTIQLLFPNVELRLDVPTAKGAGVNLHLLCPPEEVDALDRFLGNLEFSWAGRSYRADHPGLIALGRAFRNEADLKEDAALSEGAQQFKVTFEALRRQYESDAWAREHCLIGVAGGQGDGTSGVRTADGGFAARRQAIEKIASIIFSSTPQQTDFWRGEGDTDLSTLNRVYGGVKLCIHGSDAHSADGLGAPAEDRFTWLNGDPTFETLRTACLTPSTRAYIGAESPGESRRHGRITTVRVSNPEWFVSGEVPVNPGLVAIIGSRGSGKTALADLIAVAAGTDEPYANTKSFVYRAGRLLAGSVVDAEWSHGETTSCDLADGPEGSDGIRPVRYLSQQFVEQLCASDGVSDALLHEIERVVFNAWPVEQRQGATTFKELLDIRLGAARSRQRAELDTIAEIGEAITEERIVKAAGPGMKKEQADLRTRLAKVEEQIRDMTKQTERGSAERLALVNGALQERQKELQQVDRQLTDLRGLRSEVDTARTTKFPRFLDSLRQAHRLAGLSDDEWSQFAVGFADDVEVLLQSKIDVVSRQHRETGGVEPTEPSADLSALQPDQLAQCTVAALTHERQRLQQLIGLDEQRTKRLSKVEELRSELRGKIEKFELSITDSEAANERIEALVADRLDRYSDYFNALLEEEAELNALYAPLSEMLEAFGSSVAKLKLSVRRSVDVSGWAQQGEQLLDLRKTGPFRGAGELARISDQELGEAWRKGDGTEASRVIRKFAADHSKGLREQGRVDMADSDAYREWEREVSRWLYSAEHIRLTYSLDYAGLGIDRLSPGTRGIVLLLLYLAVDQSELDPLIIDQPEENLDPESVYSELVDLFRSASRRRQIIMVTHNANLVVNTDVDQVIVAHCGSLEEGRLPELEYLTGGLESPAIRGAVCEVLEGGAEAFRQRARRLRLSMS